MEFEICNKRGASHEASDLLSRRPSTDAAKKYIVFYIHYHCIEKPMHVDDKLQHFANGVKQINGGVQR